MKRLGLIGAGYLAGIVAEAYKKGMLPGYELVGILGKNEEKLDKLAKAAYKETGSAESGIKVQTCTNLTQFLKTMPDIVVEAASVAAVQEYVLPILSSHASFVALSIGAFAEKNFYENVKETARKYGQKIYLASGAVGGFDVLKTLSVMAAAEGEEMKAEICTRKGPDSLRNTPLFAEELVDEGLHQDGDITEVFLGNAKEAISLLPTKVNVAVAAALASAGPEHTKVSINSEYGMVGDDHCITAEARGCKTVIDTFSPTAEIAGWSVVALLQNLESPIEFF